MSEVATAQAKTAPRVSVDGVAGAGRLGRALDSVVSALAELAEVPSSAVSTDELAVAVLRVPEVAAMFDARIGALLKQADDRCIAQLKSVRNLNDFLLLNTNAAGVDVRARRRNARWLVDFGEFADAHAAGVLTSAHVDKLRKGLDNPRTRRLLQRDQATLIEAARTCSFRDFERACDYWANAADPDGVLPKDQVEQSYVRIRRRADQMVSIEGLLDPIAGTAALAAFERELQKLAVADTDTGEHRSQGRRGAQALVNLLTRGAARADGTIAEPLVSIVMSLDVAQAALGRHVNGIDIEVPLDPDDLDRRCELIDGTPLHPWFAAQLLTVAALQRVVFDADGRPLDASHPSRNFPKWMKHILMIRSRGRCESDGCDAPHSWLQADHVEPWSRTHNTHLDNGQILCRPHNLAKSNH